MLIRDTRVVVVSFVAGLGHKKIGWKNSSGHKRRILVDKIGEFSWTLFTNSRGHFCPLEFLFGGDFSWTLFW